jgi:hypothetical protein
MPKNGRLTREASETRRIAESALFALVDVLGGLDEIILRNEQAIRRTELVRDVLAPGIERMKQMKGRIDRHREIVKDAWREGQERNWR